MEKQGYEHELMSSMKVSKAVAVMAVPSVISSLVTVLYNMADTFFVGQTGDPLQVAAVILSAVLWRRVRAGLPGGKAAGSGTVSA